MKTPLSARDFAKRYGIDEELVRKAQNFIQSKQSIFLGVSGKLGAGKDTVAPLVLDELVYFDVKHEFFAKSLKDEVTQTIVIVHGSMTVEEAAERISKELNVELEKAHNVAERLWDDVKSGRVDNSYTRTASTRFALQYWGTEVRREQDVDYWVKKAMSSAVQLVAGGHSVFVTDARFENEIDAISELGAYTVRLMVSRKIQIERIIKRDGSSPTEEALNHTSEISLDKYESEGNFTVLVDTDNLTKDEVVAAVAQGIRESE